MKIMISDVITLDSCRRGPVARRTFVRATSRHVALPEVPADVQAAATGDWATAWIRMTAERLLSYADKNAPPSRLAA
jgi:hypothetical protein